MEVITEEEFNKLEVFGSIKPNKIYDNLKHLKIGEALVFNRDDWPLSYPPSVGISAKFPTSSPMRFKVRTFLSGDKFVALRIK